MAECSSLKQIKNMTARVLRNNNKEHGSTSTLKKNINELIRDITKQPELPDSMESIALAISEAAERYGGKAQLPDYFNVENLYNMLVLSKENIQQIDDLEASTEQITDTPQIRSKLDASRDFMDKAFGLAKEVETQFQNMTNQNLFDCLFINRGSIDGKLGPVQNTKELNDNIRNYQNQLLKNIVVYLRSVKRSSPNLKIEDDIKEILRDPKIYDNEYKYTRVLEKLKPLIDTYIKEPLFGKSDLIRETYNSSRDSNDLNNKLSKQKLLAFNSIILLDNFDTYLSVLLNKSIQIKDFNQKTGEDKYQISEKTAKLATSWRISENIFVEDEMDSITRLAINTTPFYNWGSNTPKDGYFISFSNFQHLTAKIKDLVYNPNLDNIIFDKDFEKKYKNIKIPEEIKNKSFKTLINYIRKNPRKYSHIIFDILSNDDFRKDNISLYSNFTQDELNKLYSLNKGVFNGGISLRALTSSNSQLDYYSFITQSLDSIFNVKYIQYYQDEDGKTKVRTLLDQGINNIKRKIEQTINVSNSIKLINDWESYKKSLNLRPEFDEVGRFYSLVFTIPNADIKVEILANSGDVNFVVDDFSKTKPFIDKVLKLNLSNNIDFLNSLREVFKTNYELTNNLLRFASRVIFNKYVSKELLSDLSLKDKMDKIREIYGRNAPSYNWNLDEMGLIHGNDVRTLNMISLAKSNLEGITTATQVKDGEGNSQSNQTLSRLLGSFHSQWELQEKWSNSASKSFQLLTNSEILEGVYTTKEFYNSSERSKTTTKMNVGEMSYSQIVYDFIGGIMERSDDVVGNGHILILPSINADKNTIGRLRINLNANVRIGDLIKPLKDCDSQQLEALISQEFGTFYENMYNKIQNDWLFLEQYMTSNGFPVKGLLASDLIYGFNNFNEIFPTLNTGFKSPVEFIKNQLLKYNSIHRLHPLELIDQVHYKNNDGNLAINFAIIAQIARFKPNSSIFQGNNTQTLYPSSAEFWEKKKTEILKSLLKSQFKVNTSDNSQPELKYLQDNYKKWINDSGNLILAKAEIDGKIIDIVSRKDLIKFGTDINNTIDHAFNNLYLNPILERYNYLDYLISQEFIDSTVGSFVAHSEKSGSKDVLEQEAAHILAQNKRNVSFTAAMHAFQLNILNGIPSIYNLAVIEDIKDTQGTVIGLENSIKPFDGATFVNPFVVILENNSLGGKKAGITKKQFVHFKNEATGTGGIIKTAGFGLTNDWIRNSPFLEKIMEKMTDYSWVNEDETPFITDITTNYKGEKINYKKFFFKRDGRFYQILNIQSNGNNIYSRTLQEVDANGNLINESFLEENITVNSNFRLWNFFGGKNSMELKNGKLLPSNTSVENVVLAMNSIGTIKNNIVETQDDIWQALKMSDIHYLATAGAVKQGAANINSKDRYSDEIPFDTQRIHMYQSGIQLDKEHHADDSDLSLMTQVVAACAAKGYTVDTAIGLYDALKKLTYINVKDHLQSIIDLFNNENNETIQNFQEVLMKSIIKAIATSNGENFVKTIAVDIMNQAKSGKKIQYSDIALPLSDNTVYRKIFSTISSFLTRNGIKQKIPGVLSVLTPSYEIMKLYAGRKYESFTNPSEELEVLQAQQIPIYDINDPNSNISNLELDRTYLITRGYNEEIINDDGTITVVPRISILPELIKTPKEYREIKKQIEDGVITQVVEDIRIGRNLAGYNVRFKTDKGSFQLWDLTSASALFDINELEKNWSGVQGDIDRLKEIIQDAYGISFDITLENGEQYLDAFKIRLKRWLQSDLCNLSKSTPDTIEQYKALINTGKNTREWYDKYAQWVNIKLGRSDGNFIKLNGVNTVVDSNNMRSVHKQVLNLLIRSQQVKINGEWHTVDKNSIQEQAYEVIMPKVFATKFGLSEFDDLNTIQKDEYYFVKQYLQNQTTKVNPEQYSIEFKRSDGNHLYILNKKRIPNSGLTKLTGITTYTDEDGSVYRTDVNGNILYEITIDTEIYTDQTGNEIIATDDLQHYINGLDYDTIKLSENLVNYPALLNNICKELKESSNKKAKYFGKYVTSLGNNAIDVMAANRDFHNLNLSNYQEALITNPIIKAGLEKHTSFLRSLDIVAARIPSQCMQSYMPMKVVAYENADINTAYVSTYQILLQGSDFDIDAVSLATFDIDSNGILQLWSPYTDLTNAEMRKASEKLPMPSGEEIQIKESDNIDECAYLFSKYGDLFNIKIVQNYNKETKEYTPSQTEVFITLNLNTPEQLSRFGKMLEEINTINKPSNEYIPKFMKTIGSLYNIKTEEQFNNVFQKIKDIFDNHNLYLDNVSKDKLSKIINNYTIQSMYNTIIDPVNLIQAQTSVDGTTQPLSQEADKSAKAEEAKSRTAGNFVNKYEGIVDNQVGKDSISICAVGLKSFFTLSQYSNYVLNYGTSEQQSRLLLNSNHEGYIIDGKTYKTLANIRSKDPNSIIDDRILIALSQVTNDTDAALLLSALMSLSVDNAKELKLSKLNASTKTIGMYIYGISIGMEFKDIAKLLMSPTGDIIVSLLEGNVFTGDKETMQVSDIFKYFEKCPLLYKYDINQDLDGNSLSITPLQKFGELLRQELHLKEDSYIPEVLANFGKRNYILDQKLNIIESFRNKYTTSSKYAGELYNQLIDAVEEYIIDLSSIDEHDLKNIQILAEGSKELKRLGQILSLNQGIKKNPEELINQINAIERAIYDITEKLQDILDLNKFAFSESYREYAIKRYEDIKHSFNILDVISNVPHFMGYVQTLATAKKEAMQSFKFRSGINLSLKLSNALNYKDESTIMKGIENFCGDFLRKEWMRQNNAQIIIPKGNQAFNHNGELYTLTQDIPIKLGTDWGAATFKMFMEQKVIPDLQEGRIKPNINFPGVSDNKFIKDLVNDISTKTISKNTTILYTLPINMLPRTDFDQNVLNRYRAEFNKLSKYAYQYEVSTFDELGNEQVKLSNPIPLIDLFTYYAMIAHNWKLSENSLVPILENFQNSGIIKDFHNFEYMYDKSLKTLDLNNTDLNALIPYIAPKGSPYSAYTNYIWSRDRDTRKYKLMRKVSRSELNQIGEDAYMYGIIKGYTSKSSADTNYFPSGNIESPEKTLNLSYKDGDNMIEYNITYETESNKITKVKCGSKEIKLTFEKIPFIKVNGIKEVCVELLESDVKDKLNPC